MKWKLGHLIDRANWCLLIDDKPYYSQQDKSNMPFLMFKMSYSDLIEIKNAINTELGIKE